MCFLGSAGPFSHDCANQHTCAPSGDLGKTPEGQATDQHCPDPGMLQNPLTRVRWLPAKSARKSPKTEEKPQPVGYPEAWSASQGTAGTLQSCPL